MTYIVKFYKSFFKIIIHYCIYNYLNNFNWASLIWNFLIGPVINLFLLEHVRHDMYVYTKIPHGTENGIFDNDLNSNSFFFFHIILITKNI